MTSQMNESLNESIPFSIQRHILKHAKPLACSICLKRTKELFPNRVMYDAVDKFYRCYKSELDNIDANSVMMIYYDFVFEVFRDLLKFNERGKWLCKECYERKNK